MEHHPVSFPVCDSLSSYIQASCWLLFGHNNVIIPLLHTLLIFLNFFILSYTFLLLKVLVLLIALNECFMCYVLMWVIIVPGLRVFFVDVRSLCRSNLYVTAYVACMFGVCLRVWDFNDRLINMLEPKRVVAASSLRYCYCRTFTHRCCRLSSVCLYTVLWMCAARLLFA